MATEEVPPAEQRVAMKEVEAEAEAGEVVPPTEQRGAMMEAEA